MLLKHMYTYHKEIYNAIDKNYSKWLDEEMVSFLIFHLLEQRKYKTKYLASNKS